jgi:hypothetical protein
MRARGRPIIELQLEPKHTFSSKYRHRPDGHTRIMTHEVTFFVRDVNLDLRGVRFKCNLNPGLR